MITVKLRNRKIKEEFKITEAIRKQSTVGWLLESLQRTLCF